MSELVTLRVGDVDDAAAHIRCPSRHGRERILALDTRARPALTDYLEHGRPRLARGSSVEALFLNHHGEQLTRQGFWLIIKGYARLAGIEAITPHILRHSFALDMIDHGMELREVQELLGHASLSTTQMYRHARRGALSAKNEDTETHDTPGGAAVAVEDRPAPYPSDVGQDEPYISQRVRP